MNEVVSKNKAVYFTFVVTDEHDQVMEQSDIPIGYVHGTDSDILPILESRLANKSVGERVEIVISPEDGFGDADPTLIYTDKKANVPEEFHKKGAEAQFQNEHGETRKFVVTHVDGDTVTLDGNHPYAGKTVTFAVKILKIRDAEPEEIAQGRPRDIPPSVIH